MITPFEGTTRLLKIGLSCALVLFLSETAGSADPNASPSPPQQTRPAKPKAPTYSRGLGDNLNTLHWTVCFGHMPSSGYKVDTTYPQALSMFKQIYNFTNGTHQVGYALGQDWGRFNSCPDLPEDFKPPLGNGKPGSGYANYRKLTKDVHPYNAEMGQFLDDAIAGSDDPVPDKYKSLDSQGKWKLGWKSWRNISFRNRIDDGSEWAMLDGFVRNFGMNTSVFEDAFTFDIKNESTALGGKITTDDQEWAAALEELDYLWNKYGISAFTEFQRTVYQGRVWGFWGYNDPSDEVCLNTWGNSVVFMSRTLGDTPKDMAWGSEWGPRFGDYFFGYSNFGGCVHPLTELRTMYYRDALPYFYMQKFIPESYTDDSSVCRVQFSDDLLSTYNKATSVYTLTQGNVTFADGGDRFVPQVGAGCKIIAYSLGGSNRSWTLPPTWNGIASIDRYKLSMESTPAYLDTLAVSDGHVSLKMQPDTGYVLVPAGTAATPITVRFNDKNEGDTLATKNGMTWNIPGNPSMKVLGPSAKGGFCTSSCYPDTTSTSCAVRVALANRGVLNSMKIGNRGGEGSVTLHSSNPLNPDAVFPLPAATETKLVETNWKAAETGKVTITVSNSASAANVLLNNVVYTAPAAR